MRFFLIEKTVRRVVFSFLLLGMSFLSACTTGPMEVDELYYLRSTNGENTNYYRIKVKGNTQMSKADFRQGWFPSEAVDSLFGDINEETAGQALLTKETIRKQIDAALIKTSKQYLVAAANPKTSDKTLNKLLKAHARIRLSPTSEMAYEGNINKTNTQILEYNPKRDLVVQRDGQKLVFILSANPDEIINSMSNFANEEKTEALIHKLTGKMVKGEEKKVAVLQADAKIQEKMDRLLSNQLDHTLKNLHPDAEREWVVNRLNDLLSFLESVSMEEENEKN